MKVVCYIPDYSPKQALILSAFAKGANAEVWPLNLAKHKDCDVAVIFGWYKYAYLPTMDKKAIIDRQLNKGPQHLIVIESGFYGRGHFYQIGWDGFAGDADFRNKNSPSHRRHIMPYDLRPWRFKRGKNIIICGQLPRDTQVQDVDHIAWCQKTVWSWLQAATSKEKVIFRPHPRVTDRSIYGISELIMDTRKIQRTLKWAKLCVTWNSTSCIDSVFHGIKPTAEHSSSILSQADPFPENAPNQILDEWRLQFFDDLSFAQWTVSEMREGLPWRHLTR